VSGVAVDVSDGAVELALESSPPHAFTIATAPSAATPASIRRRVSGVPVSGDGSVLGGGVGVMSLLSDGAWPGDSAAQMVSVRYAIQKTTTGQGSRWIRQRRAGSLVITEREHRPLRHRFSMHTHDEHELLWGADVHFTVEEPDRVWVVPPMLGVWIPAGVEHGGFIAANGSYHCTFFDPEGCPLRWTETTPIVLTEAVRGLLTYTHTRGDEIGPEAHARVERVIFDLIEPVGMSRISLPMPFDERARTVAQALTVDPADDRSLGEWSRAVGASPRNLTRLFDAQTGLGFAQWRAHARVSAAFGHLAAGLDIATVARRVGYSNPSAFARTFKQITGQTPSTYFAQRAEHGPDGLRLPRQE
jgi:AraC-like DNA-binding protein